MRTTIHRDKTFTYNGRRYQISQGSDQRTVEWDGYRIEAVLSDRLGDFATIEEGFWRLADVRAYLTRAEAEGWEYLPDVDGADPHGRATGDSAEGPWRDRQGDVWTLGTDGLLHTPETAPFTRAHVEKKWGPLTPLPAEARESTDGSAS